MHINSDWKAKGKEFNRKKIIGGLIILKCILEILWDGTDWILPALNWDRWRTLANTVMNFLVP
jgi:hypothetical protein